MVNTHCYTSFIVLIPRHLTRPAMGRNFSELDVFEIDIQTYILYDSYSVFQHLISEPTERILSVLKKP